MLLYNCYDKRESKKNSMRNTQSEKGMEEPNASVKNLNSGEGSMEIKSCRICLAGGRDHEN